MTTIATITHDVNGIRMDIGGRLTSWPNATWLASAHARLMIESEEMNQRNVRLESKLKDIEEILNITNLDADEACKRIEKRLGEE